MALRIYSPFVKFQYVESNMSSRDSPGINKTQTEKNEFIVK